ncbi:MAG: hypothetical protein U9N84_01640 [Actinomycetota bacterium]|nr:hypothetical protein [Actinomycetota bacterium]
MTGVAYATREEVLAATDYGSVIHAKLDRLIVSKSRHIDNELLRHFYPLTEAVTYTEYEPSWHVNEAAFWFNRDLQSVSEVTVDDDTKAAGTEYVLLPKQGPPYSRIAVDSYWNVDTVITGTWGFTNDTEPAGTLAVALTDTTGVTVDASDGSSVGVGDLLHIGNERVIVTAKTAIDTTANLNGALTAAVNDQTVTVTDGTTVSVGEVLLVDSERMIVTDIVSNDVTVTRAYDGTTLATHTDTTDVYAYRRLTVERGATGSTAATHLVDVAITRNVPPGPIKDWCIALVINTIEQESSGYAKTVGTGDNQREATGKGLTEIRLEAMRYMRARLAVI